MSHAVVMGGSIAGICAAAALARNFDRVTVVERDEDPGPVTRKGAPQGNHGHILLSRGQRIMDDLLPGAFDALLANGAHSVDGGTGFRWFQFGGWKATEHLGLSLWLHSRPMLEHHARQSLEAMGNVELRFDCAIVKPVHEGDRVTGVLLRTGEVLRADLVVDATGRGSRSSAWLSEWGYGKVPKQQVDFGLHYVSGVFEAPRDELPERACLIYHTPPVNERCGLLSPIEGGRFMVSLSGYDGDYAPTNIEGFRSWARTLLQPDIADTIERATLIGKIRHFNCPRQVRNCFTRMRRLPSGYLVVGDALCSVDPTFGQGMTLLAQQAELLTGLRPGHSTQRQQRRLERLTYFAFALTANEAHRLKRTTGWKPPMSGLLHWYLAKVFEAASEDTSAYRNMAEVMHFEASPLTLARPSVIWRSLRAAARWRARTGGARRSIEPLAAAHELSLSPPLLETD